MTENQSTNQFVDDGEGEIVAILGASNKDEPDGSYRSSHSCTIQTDTVPKGSDNTNDRQSFIIDYDRKEAGLALVLSSHSKHGRGSKETHDGDTQSSTMEMEDATTFLETDNEASLDMDYNDNNEQVPRTKDDKRCSFETCIERDEFDESRELPSIVESDSGGEVYESSETTTSDDDNFQGEKDDAQRVVFQPLIPSRKAMQEPNGERGDCNASPQRKRRNIRRSFFEDEPEVEIEPQVDLLLREPPGVLYRSKIHNTNKFFKFRSSIDLIYGDGSLGGSMGDSSSAYPSTTFGDQDSRNTKARTPYFYHGPLVDTSDYQSTLGQSTLGDNDFDHDSRRSKTPIEMKAMRVEAFFYNRGMEIAMGVLYFALNYLVAAHGAYQFTEAGGFTTEDDLLRITLPISRAGGRLVTLNCAVLLLTACKYLWTLVRTYIAPKIPIGFPIDDIMPRYHRYVALTAIIAGCIVHSLPQMANFLTLSTTLDDGGMRIWTFGDGLAAKQLLLTGTLLIMIFSTFYLTTLKAFRKTAAGFRWFWFFHVGGVAAAYPLLLIHGTCRGYPIFLYVGALPLLLYLLDVLMRRSKISTAKIIRWKTHEDEGQEITELVVERPANFEYTPGQYVELQFHPVSEREWHPFTIASAPNEEAPNKNEIVFYIKNLGRWSGAFFDYASAFDLLKSKQPPKIYMRGPHGAPATNYFKYKHIVVIGSGIGVAPLISIWKYLIAKGKTMTEAKKRKLRRLVTDSMHRSIVDASENVLLSNRTPNLGLDDDEITFGESLEMAAAKAHTTIRADCIFVQTILESMTVSLSLFAIFILGETFTIVLWIFGSGSAANTAGFCLSIFALIVHGTTILASTIAMGWSVYSRHFRCWLEFSIVFMDSIALWFSVHSNLDDPEEEQEYYRQDTLVYLTFFGYVVVLHAIRIFHMFYMTLKPATKPATDRVKKRRKSGEEEEICSVEGILINRKYSNMRFAAKDLLPPIAEENLSDFYSMKFYGTREHETEETEEDLIDTMMGSKKHVVKIRNSLLYSKQDNYFCAGRPDWNRTFLNAIARAHCTSEEGESVGIFFCGSPAIAKDLQEEAKRLTAQHQFAMKLMNGKACKCRLIVHSETF